MQDRLHDGRRRKKISFVMASRIVSTIRARNEESETHSGEPRHAEFGLEHYRGRGIATSASRNKESDTDSDEESDTDSDEHDKGRPRNEESETRSGEPRHAEFEPEHDQERGIAASASRNEESDKDSDEESDTDSDEHDKGNSGPISTSKNVENAADSDEQNKNQSVPASTPKNDSLLLSVSLSSSAGDVETEQEQINNSFGDSSIDVLDALTFTEEKDDGESGADTNTQETQSTETFTEEKDEGDTNMPVTQSSPEAFADEHYEPSFPIDEVIIGSIEIARETGDDSNKQLGDNAGVTVSTSEEKETQGSPVAFADDHYESSLPVDEVVKGSMEITFESGDDSNKQILGDNVGALVSTPEERIDGDQRVSLQSHKAPNDEENKPSSSQMNVTRDKVPELVGFDEHGLHDLLETEDQYVKKGFKCEGNTEVDDEEQLREYWTRALQTSTSTGEVVEEIVKVLKHHQKTHDLLCPVCGSCVTRKVILRKRKRSSLISVDRWYRDPLDEAEVQEQGSSLEVMEAVEEQDAQEYQDTEAFGCLSCFSLFFEKGRQFLNHLQADIGPDNFNCLPFFFPPYPWGMTQMKHKRPGFDEEAPTLEVIEELEEPPTTDVRSSFSCGIGSTLLPDYPWGTMPKDLHEEGPTSEEAEELAVSDVRESLTTVAQSDYTCGIGSKLLPDYPWGTMPYLSKGEVIQPDTVIVEEARVVSQSEETSQPLFKERTCTCGLAPALLPAYPWGYCTKSDSSGEQIQGPEPVDAISDAVEKSTCTCGLAPVLFPDYSWGSLSKVEEVALQFPSDVEAGPKDSSALQVEDTLLQAASQHEISEEVPQLHREGRNCTDGLLPALLPDYPWGFVKDEGAYNMQTRVEPQAQTVEEIKGKGAEDKESRCDVVSVVLPDYPWGMTTESEEVLEEGPIENRKARRESMQSSTDVHIGSAILPSYPWGTCSVNQSVHEQNCSARDCTCGLGPAMLPKFPWGQTQSAVDKQDQTGIQQVESYIEQETKIEARITSKTDVFTVTTSKLTYSGEKPPQNIKTMIPQQTSQTVQHVKLDQTVTVINASVKVEEVPAIKGSSLTSLPSTGFALLDLVEEGLTEKGRLETRPSTGYAYLEELNEEAESTGKDTAKTPEQPTKTKVSKVSFSPTMPAPPHTQLDNYEPEPPESEIQEDPMSLKYSQPETKSEETFHKPGKTRPQLQPSGTQFPSFQWPVGIFDAGDLTTPLLTASVESEAEIFISVLKPPPGVDEPKSENWLSTVSKPPDEEGITAPLLSTTPGYMEEIEEVKLPVVRPQIPSVAEAVIDVPPGDLGGTSLGTVTSTAVAVPAKKKEADEWDILKSIVYGGLDISVASLGVTSSAAGGNAITRTVVYMGLATLFSGLIGFYHNVLNLYHYHRDHYTELVGVSLMLHGTLALISYVVFGLLSPLTYAFSYRETDDRDEKFMLCCGVTIVAVTALALGKARVSNKRYLRTLSAYVLGGVLAAIVGYLTGEHVAELLEEWGI